MTPPTKLDEPTVSAPGATKRRPRVCVLGATLGTGNLGVDALGISMVQGLLAAMGNVEVVFQCWRHDRPVEIPLAEHNVVCKGLVVGSKESWRRRDGIRHMRALARWRNRWRWTRGVENVSRALRQLASCDVALDVSAGDSFADIYGPEGFWYQAEIKELCLDLGVPLVLMPQTYGPFNSPSSAARAASILSRATLACTREAEGQREIETLCGALPLPRIIRTPDLAFNLLPTETRLPNELDNVDETVIGLNVSGLLYFACRKIGLEADYADLARRLIAWAMSKPRTRLMFIPHVIRHEAKQRWWQRGVYQGDADDRAACRAALKAWGGEGSERICWLRGAHDAARVKYGIGRCDFFVGARMHAFIASASQCIPGALLAYSKKAAGLAGLVGIDEAVVDLRWQSAAACVDAVDRLYESREALRGKLRARIPQIKQEVNDFFSDELAPLIYARAGIDRGNAAPPPALC